MKKIIISAVMTAGLMLSATSCGCGEKCNVDNDTIITPEMADSLSLTLGAFDGTRANPFVRQYDDMNEYLEGFQMIVGNKFSYSKQRGMADGLYVLDEIEKKEFILDTKLNRDLYLQEFRKFVQDTALRSDQQEILYNRLEELNQAIEKVLQERETKRRQQEENTTAQNNSKTVK